MAEMTQIGESKRPMPTEDQITKSVVSKFSLEDDLENHQKRCRLRPPAAVAVG